MVTKHCCYGTCNSDTRYNHKPHMKEVTFLRFPQPTVDLEKCRRWLAACQRVGFTQENVKKHTYICTKHFVGGRGPTDQYPDPIPAGLEPMVLQSAVTQKLTYPVTRKPRATNVRKPKKVESDGWVSQKLLDGSVLSKATTNRSGGNVSFCSVPKLQETHELPSTPSAYGADVRKRSPVLTRKRRASAPSVLTTVTYSKQKRYNGPSASSFLSSQASKKKLSSLDRATFQPTISLVPFISESGELILTPINSTDVADHQVLQSHAAVSSLTTITSDFSLLVPTSMSASHPPCESASLSTPAESNFIDRKLQPQDRTQPHDSNSTVPNFSICLLDSIGDETTIPASELTSHLNSETTEASNYVCDNVTIKLEPESNLCTAVMYDSINLQPIKGELGLQSFSCGSSGLDLACSEVCIPETGVTTYEIEYTNSCNSEKNGTNENPKHFPISVDGNLQLCTLQAIAEATLADGSDGTVNAQPVLTETIESLLLMEAQNCGLTNENCKNIKDSTLSTEIYVKHQSLDDKVLASSPKVCSKVLDEQFSSANTELSAASATMEANFSCTVVHHLPENNNQEDNRVAELTTSCSKSAAFVEEVASEMSCTTVKKSNDLQSEDICAEHLAGAPTQTKLAKTKVVKPPINRRRRASIPPKKLVATATGRKRGRRKRLCQTPVAITYVSGSSMQPVAPQTLILNSLTGYVEQNPDPSPIVNISSVQLPASASSTSPIILKNVTQVQQKGKAVNTRQTSYKRQLRPIAPNPSVMVNSKSQGSTAGLLLNNTPFLIQNSSTLQMPNASAVSRWKFYNNLMSEGWSVRIDDKRHFHLINNFGVTKSVVLDQDRYSISIFDNVLPADHPSLTFFPAKIVTDSDLSDLLKHVKSLKVCIGNSEEKFIRMVLETGLPKVKFCRISNCVYSSVCSIALVEGLRCDHCLRVRTILQHMVRRKENKYLRILSEDNTGKEKEAKLMKVSKSNVIPEEPKVYLSVAELRSKIYSLKRKLKAERQKNLRLRIKLKSTTNGEKEFLEHDHNLSVDLDTFDKDSFCYKFIQEQIRASKCKQKGMRWHPSILKWCTNLRNKSPTGYTLMRQEFRLPSERTLCNYAEARHATPAKNKIMNGLETNGASEVQECVITIIRRPEGDDCLLANADDATTNRGSVEIPNSLLSSVETRNDQAANADSAMLTDNICMSEGRQQAIRLGATSIEKEAAAITVDSNASDIDIDPSMQVGLGAQKSEITDTELGAVRNNSESVVTSVGGCTFTDVEMCPATNTSDGCASNSEEGYTVAFVGDSAGGEVVQYIIQDLRQTLVTIDGTEYVIEEMVPPATMLDDP